MDVRFNYQQIVSTFDSKLSYVERQMALGIMTKKQAIQTLRPELDQALVDKWLKEINDANDDMDGVRDALSRASNSQFSAGNTEASGPSNERMSEASVQRNSDTNTNPDT